MPKATKVAITPSVSDTRPPVSVRTNRSRPNSSVPNQWPMLGGLVAASKSEASGSIPRMTGPRKQARKRAIMMAKPAIAAGFRISRSRASRVWLRPLATAGAAAVMSISVIAHLRVEQRIAEIDDQIGDDDEEAVEDDHAQHQCVVPVQRGLDKVSA